MEQKEVRIAQQDEAIVRRALEYLRDRNPISDRRTFTGQEVGAYIDHAVTSVEVMSRLDAKP